MRSRCIRRTDVVPSKTKAVALALLLAIAAPAADAQWLRDTRPAAAPGEPTLRWTLTPESAPAPVTMVRGRGRTTMIVGAAITSIDAEDLSDDRITNIAALVPQAAIGFRVSNRVAVEVPFSLQSSKSDDDDDRFTQIDIGVRPSFAIYGSDAVAGIVNLTLRANRISYGDLSSTRLGWEIAAGPQFRLNDALSFRPTLAYGQYAEDEDEGIPKESYYALNLDLVHDLSAPGPRQSGGLLLRAGAAFTSVDPEVGDGETTIEIPSPYFGAYFGLSDCDCIRIGGDIEFSRISQGDASQMDLTFLPGIEYDLVPPDRMGIRIRGFGLLSHQSFDSGSFDQSGTITGFGGGVSLVIPTFARYRSDIGFSYIRASENEDLGFPQANIIRFTYGIELPN